MQTRRMVLVFAWMASAATLALADTADHFGTPAAATVKTSPQSLDQVTIEATREEKSERTVRGPAGVAQRVSE